MEVAAGDSGLGLLAIRGGAIRVAGFVTGVLVSLGAAAILVRHVGISDFGRYVTVLSLIGLVSGVTEAGIAVYGIREFGARTGSARRDLLANLLGLRLALTGIGVGCAVVFSIVVGYGHILVIGAALAGAGLLVQVAIDVLSVALQAQLQLGRLTLVDLTRRILMLILIATLATANARLLPFFAVSILAGVIALALVARMVRPSVEIRLAFDLQMWRALIAETLPLALAVSIGALYFYVTVIVMSLIATATQTGLFATAFRVTQVALAIPGLLLTAIFPLMSRQRDDQEDGFGEMIGKIFAVAAICGVWLSVCLALGAGVIIDVIAGHQGRAASAVLRIQSLVVALNFVTCASAFCLLSLRRYRPMMIASTLALVINIVLALVLVPALGARGGSLADVLTEIVVAAGLTASLLSAVPRTGVSASFLPALAVAGALSSSVWFAPIGSVPRIAAATVIYFGILGLTRTIPEEVTRAIRGMPIIRALL